MAGSTKAGTASTTTAMARSTSWPNGNTRSGPGVGVSVAEHRQRAVCDPPQARPGAQCRAIAFPTQVVVDLTTWNTTRERSRLPVNTYTGYVDILVNPNGSGGADNLYSTPASFGLASAFFHFWLAERATWPAPARRPRAPLLPLPQGLAQRVQWRRAQGGVSPGDPFARTRQITTNENPPFDNPPSRRTGSLTIRICRFVAAQQGVSGCTVEVDERQFGTPTASCSSGVSRAADQAVEIRRCRQRKRPRGPE